MAKDPSRRLDNIEERVRRTGRNDIGGIASISYGRTFINLVLAGTIARTLTNVVSVAQGPAFERIGSNILLTGNIKITKRTLQSHIGKLNFMCRARQLQGP